VGGAETYLRAMSERLVRDGHAVTVATTNASRVQCFWDPRQPRLLEGSTSVNGVSVIRSRLGHLPLSPWTFYLLRRLATELARLPHQGRTLLDGLAPYMPAVPNMESDLERLTTGFDVVHSVNISLEWPLIVGLRYARRHRLPFVVTPFVHVGDREVERFYTMPHQLAALRDADCVIVQTDIEARKLTLLGVSQERIVRLGMGVDLDHSCGGDGERFRAQHGIDGPVVTFMGAVTDDKGIVHLTRAMQHLWQGGSTATLVIAGQPMEPTSFERAYADLPETHRQRVRRMGVVSGQLKQDMLAGTDLFAMPSRVDSFGIVYLEAWSYGVPVVGCRSGGVPDVVEHGQDGLLVPFGNQALLALAIESLLDAPERRRAMGQRGRAKVEAHYTWDSIYAKLRATYQDLLEMPSSEVPLVTSEQAVGPITRMES
jgi:glycosyltransferase involved in cell wall biosynthesis